MHADAGYATTGSFFGLNACGSIFDCFSFFSRRK
jgi:hypothetical protein